MKALLPGTQGANDLRTYWDDASVEPARHVFDSLGEKTHGKAKASAGSIATDQREAALYETFLL